MNRHVIFAIASVLTCTVACSTPQDATSAETTTSAPSTTLPASDNTTVSSDTAAPPTAPSSTLKRDATGAPVPVLPDGDVAELNTTDFVVGDGDEAQDGDQVEFMYLLTLTDGTEIANSYTQQTTGIITIGESNAIPGLLQGLDKITAGTVRQIDIPAALGYGTAGDGRSIPPDTDLVFVVEVMQVTTPVPPSTPERADAADCPALDGTSEKQQTFSEYPPFCIDIDATYTATIDTRQGSFTVELDPSKAPLAVNNFVVLARYRYFDDTVCHRVVKDFVVQCGDPTATGSGGPGYRFADELPEAGEYKIGGLAMANSGPNTNGSQFFVITGPNGTTLPPSYTLFGKVTAGLDSTVSSLNELADPNRADGPPTEEITITSVTITGP